MSPVSSDPATIAWTNQFRGFKVAGPPAGPDGSAGNQEEPEKRGDSDRRLPLSRFRQVEPPGDVGPAPPGRDQARDRDSESDQRSAHQSSTLSDPR